MNITDRRPSSYVRIVEQGLARYIAFSELGLNRPRVGDRFSYCGSRWVVTDLKRAGRIVVAQPAPFSIS